MEKILNANLEKRLLSIDGVSFFCFLGKNGITENKIEGDWKTPKGIFQLRKIYYRKDRIPKMHTELESIPISENDAWCDDPESPKYNSFVKLPFNSSYENLWREDGMYDVIIIIGYNDDPIIKNKGSAIFIHIAREKMEYTQGCLAIKKEDMVQLLSKIDSDTQIQID